MMEDIWSLPGCQGGMKKEKKNVTEQYEELMGTRERETLTERSAEQSYD